MSIIVLSQTEVRGNASKQKCKSKDLTQRHESINVRDTQI